MYKTIYSPKAREDLRALDFHLREKITRKICFYSRQEDVLKFARTLTGELNGLFRFRIGDYRAIFSMEKNDDDKIIYVVRVGHRGNVYD